MACGKGKNVTSAGWQVKPCDTITMQVLQQLGWLQTAILYLLAFVSADNVVLCVTGFSLVKVYCWL